MAPPNDDAVIDEVVQQVVRAAKRSLVFERAIPLCALAFFEKAGSCMADLSAALANLERACAELESYLALPVAHARDKAGLIQGFEFTFELFWKTFPKLAPDAGLEASSPREALMAGVALHLIATEESAHWAQMLRDRDLTSHTYNAHVADEITARLLRDHAPCFRQALDAIRASLISTRP